MKLMKGSNLEGGERQSQSINLVGIVLVGYRLHGTYQMIEIKVPT